jgi:hypothetical protein
MLILFLKIFIYWIDEQAALKVNGERICSGVLVNESFIITAARCVYL